MSEGGKLSQEEIDALLGRVSQMDEVNQESETFVTTIEVPELNTVLSPMEQDALGEIGNISFGSAATALSTLLNQKVEITTPTVALVSKNSLDEEFPIPHVLVRVEYTEGFRGSNVLLINTMDAGIIADLMLGGDGRNPSEEIGEIQLSAVQEAMNQMMGSSSTAMSTMFNKRIDISPPVLQVLDVEQDRGLDYLPNEPYFLKIKFQLKVGDLIDSNIMQIVPIDFAKELVNLLMNPNSSEPEMGGSLTHEGPLPIDTPSRPAPSVHVQDERTLSDRLGSHYFNFEEEEGEEPHPQPTPPPKKQKPVVPVQPLAFSPLEEISQDASDRRNIDLLLDIPLNVTVELGRTNRLIKDILALVPGTVVELDKLAGEPVDILINNKRIAKGEVVVIEENFGVRITEIMNKRDRLRNLNG